MSKKNVVRARDIKKLFKGKNDITLRALSDLGFYLGMVTRVDLVPKEPRATTPEGEE